MSLCKTNSGTGSYSAETVCQLTANCFTERTVKYIPCLYWEHLFWQHGKASWGGTAGDTSCQTHSLVIRKMWSAGLSLPREMLWLLSRSVTGDLSTLKGKNKQPFRPKGMVRHTSVGESQALAFLLDWDSGSQLQVFYSRGWDNGQSPQLWHFIPGQYPSFVFQTPFLGTSHLIQVLNSTRTSLLPQ